MSSDHQAAESARTSLLPLESSGDQVRREFDWEQIEAFHAHHRSLPLQALMILVILCLPLLGALPGAENLLHLSTRDLLAAYVAIPALVGATFSYRRVGAHGRLYALMDRLESLTVQVVIGYLICASGRPDHIFWLLFIVHVMMAGGHPGFRRLDWVTLLATPIIVIAWHFWRDGLSIGVGYGVVGLLLGALVLAHGVGLEHTIGDLSFERTQLMRRLALSMLGSERARIARDLHDGATADLTAIAWRADSLAGTGEVRPEDVAQLSRRARTAIADIRAAVWALKRDPISWSDLLLTLRTRAEDLCWSRCRLEFEAVGDTGTLAPNAAVVDIVRIVQELVRNALEHGAPNAVFVRIGFGDDVVLDVRDDGAGFRRHGSTGRDGGLENLRFRAALHNGFVEIHPSDTGTRMRVVLRPDCS